VHVGSLDLDDFERRILCHLDAGASDPRVLSLARLPAGMSSLTYLAEVGQAGGTRRIVLKIATPGVAPTRNRDVLRQARVLRLLADDGRVPVPRLLFTDDGAPPEVPPFFAVEFVQGQNLEPLEDGDPDDGLPGDGDLRGRYLDAARLLGRLHSIEAEAAGLGDEAVEDCRTELDKWARVFDAVPEELWFTAKDCERALRGSLPEVARAVLVHGDYRLGNTLCASDRIAAVIDWEIWAIGDPRCDLAWFLNSANSRSPTTIRPDLPVPSRDDLVTAYVQASGRPTVGLAWFEALMLYKRAASTALIVKHNRRSATPDARKERMADTIAPILDAASRTLEKL
jgi:aminoglycoside phosphotransferase (APT) family kinase protein